MERYLPHTSDDDDSRYRSEEELGLARLHDPLTLLRERLAADGVLSAARDEEMRAEAVRQVNEATDFVESAGYPSTDTFGDHVYAPGGPHPNLPQQTGEGIRGTRLYFFQQTGEGTGRLRRAWGRCAIAERNVLEAIRDAMLEEMRRDDDVFVLGEDIGQAGAACSWRRTGSWTSSARQG